MNEGRKDWEEGRRKEKGDGRWNGWMKEIRDGGRRAGEHVQDVRKGRKKKRKIVNGRNEKWEVMYCSHKGRKGSTTHKNTLIILFPFILQYNNGLLCFSLSLAACTSTNIFYPSLSLPIPSSLPLPLSFPPSLNSTQLIPVCLSGLPTKSTLSPKLCTCVASCYGVGSWGQTWNVSVVPWTHTHTHTLHILMGFLQFLGVDWRTEELLAFDQMVKKVVVSCLCDSSLWPGKDSFIVSHNTDPFCI